MRQDGTKQNVQPRNCFLDRLRVAATCAVVLLHTVTGVMDRTDMSAYPLEKTVFLVVLDLTGWCVPLFLLISGYLFLDPDREITFGKMITKYCRRIVLALFLFGVPYACIELAMTEHTFRAGMLWEAVLLVCRGQTWSHMWYLYLILLLYLLTPAIRKLLRHMPGWALYVLLALLLVCSSILPFLRKLCGWWEWMPAGLDEGIYLFYYLCGYLLVSRRGEPGRGVRRILAACILLLLGGMTCSRLVGNYTVQMAYNYPFTVAVSLLLALLARGEEARFRRGGAALFQRLGALCFAVYLVHPVFLNLLYKGLHVSLMDFPIWASLPGIYLGALLLSALTAWIMCRIPVLRKYVL